MDAAHLTLLSYTPDTLGTGFTVDVGWAKFHCVTDALCTLTPITAPVKPAKPQPQGGVATTQPGGNAQAQPGAGQAVTTAAVRPGKAPFDLSPDKKLAVFIRDHNLWVRTEATGEERQLTMDGVQDYGYATDNAGWVHSDAPIVLWSADSKKIATFQMDERKTGMMYLVPVTNAHPLLES